MLNSIIHDTIKSYLLYPILGEVLCIEFVNFTSNIIKIYELINDIYFIKNKAQDMERLNVSAVKVMSNKIETNSHYSLCEEELEHLRSFIWSFLMFGSWGVKANLLANTEDILDKSYCLWSWLLWHVNIIQTMTIISTLYCLINHWFLFHFKSYIVYLVLYLSYHHRSTRLFCVIRKYTYMAIINEMMIIGNTGLC